VTDSEVTAPDWLNDARAMHGLPALDKPKPAPVDASDPKQIKAAQRAARIDARQMAATLAAMMEQPQVRAWMYRLLVTCGAFRANDFPTVPIDPLQLARNAAHREIAQSLIADILGCAPEAYLAMLKEHTHEGTAR